MEYNARKAFWDVKKSGINSKRDRDRYILLQEILKKIEGRAKLGEKSIIIEEPRVDWDFLIPVKEIRIYSRPKIPSIQRLDFSYLLERWWERINENIPLILLAILVLIFLIWLNGFR